MAYNLFVLGPAPYCTGDVHESGRPRLGQIVAQMADALSAGDFRPFRVIAPESRDEASHLKLFMSGIEAADLVILDLTGNNTSIAYEAGIVHALGIPHIFVTEDAETLPAFPGDRVIRGLQIEAGFDRAKAAPGQRELFERLSQFLISADVRRAMSKNNLTSHFGLPLVDLVGPAGMAASYYVKAVRPFTGPNGFAGRRCTLLFKEERTSRFSPGKSVVSTRSVATTIKALVAVEPPSQLSRSFQHDDLFLKTSLNEMGVPLLPGVISGDDALGQQDYKGCFCAKGVARGSAVCVEIPAILYPLAESPWILRLKQRTSLPDSEQARMMEEVEERALEKLLASFRRNLIYHLDLEPGANRDAFHYVPLSELKGTLKKLGIL